MSEAATPSKADIEAVERDLYARLGLTPNATREELVAAYEAVQAYLGGAPRDLRDWAKARSSEVDEAYALLSDPAALAGAVALVGAVERPARQPGGSATPPARRATPPVAEPDDEDADEGTDADELVAAVSPDTHRDSVRAPRRPAAKAPTARSRRRNRLLRRAAAGVAAVAVIAVVAVAGYNYGPGASAANGQPGASAAAASPSPTLDMEKVTALMEKIAANPKDTDSLLGLADAYFAIGDYQTAGEWAQKVVDADASNVEGYVALGAAQYNQGDQTDAETAWKKAISLDPKNVEAHYDLGFLYFAAQPQDKQGAISEWQTVVALDPGSDLASSLQAHLDSMIGSPAPSGSLSPSQSPAASPEASASPAASSSAQP
jgi:cytochrome c-type biogenesis protein CcmH/NrfG